MKHQMLSNASSEVDFDLDEVLFDGDEASLSDLGSYDEDESNEVEGLGYVGLGRARRARKGRKSRRRGGKARARRVRRVKKARKSRKARASRRPRRKARRARRVRVAAPAPVRKPRRRRKSASKKATAIAGLGKPRRRRKSSARRGRRMSGLGASGFGRALGKLADTVALQSISGLGKAGRKRRKSRRRKGAAVRRVRAARRRKSAGRRKVAKRSRGKRRGARRARRGSRRMSGLGWGMGSLGRMGASLADSEVANSWPVVGPFQYIFSMPGLEAISGVTLAGIIGPIVSKGVFEKLGAPMAEDSWQGRLSRVGSATTSAILLWELGRLLGSGNLAKFGAFYTFGRVIENELTAPYVTKKVLDAIDGPKKPAGALKGYGLGQSRIPDQDELRDLGYLAQSRIPDQDELRGMGQRIVTEEELLGEGVGEDAEDETNLF